MGLLKKLKEALSSERKIVGEITYMDRNYSGGLFFHRPVTLYHVMREDGAMHRCGMLGHYSGPNLNDKVEMQVSKYNDIAIVKSIWPKYHADGSFTNEEETNYYYEIKRYKKIK